MNPQKHIYFITVSDIQRVAREVIERNLNEWELQRVVERALDTIQWYDPIEQAILEATQAKKNSG